MNFKVGDKVVFTDEFKKWVKDNPRKSSRPLGSSISMNGELRMHKIVNDNPVLTINKMYTNDVGFKEVEWCWDKDWIQRQNSLQGVEL